MGEWDTLFDHPDHEVEIEGLTVLVRDGIFTPDPSISYSSTMFIVNLPDVSGSDILDVGTGSGVLALYSAQQGARVVASDIDEKAIANAEENVSRYDLENRIQLVKSDLFDEVEGKFDYILANLPINDEVWTIGESTTNLIGRFLTQCPDYVKENGKVYFGWASFSDVEPVKKVCQDLGYDFEIKTEDRLGHTWYLFEVSF